MTAHRPPIIILIDAQGARSVIMIILIRCMRTPLLMIKSNIARNSFAHHERAIIMQIQFDDYVIEIDDSIINYRNDRNAIRALLEMQLNCANHMRDIAQYEIDNRIDIELTQFDYSGDHDDYNPACASILMMITNALCGGMRDECDDANDAIMILIHDSDFRNSFNCIDFDLHELIKIEYIDDNSCDESNHDDDCMNDIHINSRYAIRA